jgi:hypothetical protein
MGSCGCSRKPARCQESFGGGEAGWSPFASPLFIRWQSRSSRALPPSFVDVYESAVCAKNWQLGPYGACWVPSASPPRRSGVARPRPWPFPLLPPARPGVAVGTIRRPEQPPTLRWDQPRWRRLSAPRGQQDARPGGLLRVRPFLQQEGTVGRMPRWALEPEPRPGARRDGALQRTGLSAPRPRAPACPPGRGMRRR